MEIVVRTADFARVLRLAQSLADRKNTVPVLGSLLIRTDAKGLTITGTDMELGGISYCPAAIRATGSVAIPAQRLCDYVHMLPDGELVLKAQNSGWVSLTCGRSRSRIATLAAESFPELPKPPREGISFSAGLLARLIEKASVAVSSESLNTTLAGALLKIDNALLTMVATDSHRLALATAPVAIPALKEPVDVLIPRKTLAAFLRFAEGRNDQPVRCGVTDNHLFFVWHPRITVSPTEISRRGTRMSLSLALESFSASAVSNEIVLLSSYATVSLFVPGHAIEKSRNAVRLFVGVATASEKRLEAVSKEASALPPAFGARRRAISGRLIK